MHGSTKDHVEEWKKQKENISSDPEGLTFTRYKASSLFPNSNASPWSKN
jgi:hypothetical protein